MFQCFETPDMGPGIFTFFLFQFVSKRFEKIETVDLDILSLFQYVSVSLLYNLYVSMFQNTRYGAWNFTFLCFSCFETFRTIESVDLEIFLPVSLCFSSFYYIIYMFQCFETPDMGPEFSPFFVSV